MNKKQILIWALVVIVVVAGLVLFNSNKSEAPSTLEVTKDVESQLQETEVRLPSEGGEITMYPVYAEKQIGSENGIVKNIIGVVKQDFGETKIAYLVSFESNASSTLTQKSSLILGEIIDVQSILTEDVVGADYAVRVNFLAPYNVVALNNSGTSNREIYVTVNGGVFDSNTAEFVK